MDTIQTIEKLPSGIDGLDFICHGGLPLGRTTLVAGSAGSAKTVFAAQFLAEGILQSGQNGVFVTFEEAPEDIRRNMRSFGWDIAAWEKAGKWIFVDASPLADEQALVTGDYDLSALMVRVEFAVRQVRAERLSMDSLGAILTQFSDVTMIRHELFRVTAALRVLQVTSILTAERLDDYGPVGRYGVEEYVADNVIILRNILSVEKRRRTIEILKFRGTTHYKGEYPFTVLPGKGMVVIPLAAMELKQRSNDLRITTGNDVLDSMCGGGFFRDSITLVSGATGTGKTMMTTEFMAGGVRAGERTLLLAFEESRDQLFRNATGWGIDYEKMEAAGLLRVVCEYPEAAGLEDHLLRIKTSIDDFKPQRLAVDSLSALERVAGENAFREFVIGLSSFIKQQEIAGLFTATTATLLGGASVTEAHISTLTDSIILMRYVEMYGEMRRGLTILKMRGSRHEKVIREFTIDHQGMHIGVPFNNVFGILSGNPVYVGATESDRITSMFQE
jgi:circadian clock protein KaiC